MNIMLQRPGLVTMLVLVSLGAGAPIAGLPVTRRAVASEATGPATKQSAVAQAPSAAKVQLEAAATERDGATGRPRSTQAFTLAVGQSLSRFLAVDRTSDSPLCDARFKAQPVDDVRFLWRFDLLVVRIADGVTRLQLHWTRTRGTDVDRDETITFAVRPNESRVLDFVEDSDASSACASLLVSISAQPVVPADARPVAVDLWTVDEANATTPPVHARVAGLAGAFLTYKLDPIEIAPATATRPEPVTMSVSGSATVVVTADGLVEVELSTASRTMVGNNSAEGRGRVHFRAKPGETAALLLPGPSGRLMVPGGGSVDLARAFAGHQMALYVRVQPQ